MLLIRKLFPKLICCGVLSVILSLCLPENLHAQNNPPDTTLHFPISDHRGDPVSDISKNPYDLKGTRDSVVYDPATHRYVVYEKVGNKYYRTPTTYSFDEYWQLRGRQAEMEYFMKRANTTSILNRGKVKPKLSIYDNLFNRLFGNGKINITPQGNVGVTAGYQGQNIKNPTLPERARKNGGFDFDMQSQLNVNADIGGKLKFPISYNTLANFGQDNQLKLDYTGLDDEIIKRFELGNVNFPSRSTLIPGAQQLFGVKAQLQFGKLFITGVIANQKSQRQTANLQGGSSTQLFEVKADEYEENRHFLAAQYFRANYNKVMSNLPAPISPIKILRMEVWVTNKNGTTTDTRDVVGLANLGEDGNLLNPGIPTNGSNNIYGNIVANASNRDPSLVYNNLLGLGLQPVQDFEKTYARKLDSTQYTFNPVVGFISLNQPLQTDDVLAVAYQYSYNGKIFQVGEFSQDLPPDSASATQKILFLKLLKATSQRPNLPIWKLMLKNVYAIGYGSLTPTDFQLNVLYAEPGLGTKPYVPFGDMNQGKPLISLINLDRLNNQLDPQPDGVFDYVEGYTVFSQYSRIMFPVLEPFGRDLAQSLYSNPTLGTIKDTLYYALYDSIKAVAQQYPNLNRFELKGQAKISGSSDISIGYNIPRGSVTVTAGGRTLLEGVDYDINYDLGTIKIINTAIINAGLPVQVNYENNAGYGLQTRNYTGLRFDYNLKNTAKEQISFGGTLVRLGERPFFNKTTLGEDPIRNTMYGLDVNYRKDVPRLTKLLDKLPFYEAKAPSTINFFAEGAALKPGHAPQIGKGSNGTSYLDDFEASKSGIDLRFPQNNWALASTPLGSFPEAALNDNLDYGKNRAKIAWYQIEQTLQQYKGVNNPLANNADELSDPRVRLVYQKEIFPQRTTGFGESYLQTFDISYYPTDKGPYNFDDQNITANGKLANPTLRWGGLMRSLDQTDFETANIEFVEFWMQDPYINSKKRLNASSSNGGKLFFDFGNVSEDILKDGKRFYENGITTPNAPAPMDQSNWGRVPKNPIQVTNAFSNNPDDRVYQDVGLDGLDDTAEVNKFSTYLNNVKTQFGAGSTAYTDAIKDPSNDDYQNYRGDNFDQAGTGILGRYKNYNGPQGNSPIAGNSTFTTASTLYPDAEDLNRDNTLNQTEEYFEYGVDIKPANASVMSIGSNFIVDKKVVTVSLADGTSRPETWYQFRIPLDEYSSKVGNIPDFKSIRFVRMYLTGFDDSVTLRFGELQLTRNTWRNFQYKIDTSGIYTPITNGATTFSVGAVNIEENDKRTPLPYRTPKDIERQQTLSSNGVTLLQNEQSMTLQFCNLSKGDARGVFQTFPSKDLRQYKTIAMYIHAEQAVTSATTLKANDLTAVIRFGTDFVNNYYQIRIPLTPTGLGAGNMDPNSDAYNDTLWIPGNSLGVDIQSLIKLKTARDADPTAVQTKIYRQLQANGQEYAVIGSPNFAEVRGILISVENTNVASGACGEMWVNELRLVSLDEKGGYAALGRVDATLSDLGTISLSGNIHTAGFGTLEQRINERYRDNFAQFDVSANLELGKLLPKKAAISLPLFASYSQSVSTPEYDAVDKDVKLKDKLSAAKTKAQRDSIKNDNVDFSSTTTINFTNVRKNRTSTRKPKIYDLSNFDLSYSYLNTKRHNPLIESNEVTKHHGALGYQFAPQPKYITPFKQIFKKTKTHWFDLVKDFNFNPIPSTLSFRADINRQFGAIRPRSIGASKYAIPETYDKYFTFQRDYIVRWNFTKSLNFDFNASNNARVDEPAGRLDTRQKKDSMWNNFLKGGRNTVYRHTANFTYALPTNKLPLLDWTTVNLTYQAGYDWVGASRLAVNLGNIIENNQQREATAQFDFNRLYQKSKWLRQLEQPSNIEDREKWRSRITKVKDTVTTKTGKKIVKTRKIVDKTAMPYVGGVPKILGKLLTSIKQASATISENGNTRLPGYMDSTKYFGQNWSSMAPGVDFLLGRQPDTSWLNRAAAKGLITKDTTFNSLFTQNFNQTITASAQLTPIKDLNITLNIKKTFNKNYSETFRFADTSGGTNYKFGHLNPYAGGGFDISFIAYKTLFGKFDPNRVSETFRKFQDYRLILSQRLGQLNPYSKTQPIGTDGYSYGYGRYAVDVLVPAFIAAYTGKDPTTVSLIKQNNANIKSNPFKDIVPKLNWKVDYNGLSRVKGLDKIFTNFSISHGYTGNLSMNGFTSALLYQDISRFGYPSFYDTISKNFIPYFLVPNVSIGEQFQPLLGLDMMFTNQAQFKIEFAKSRQLSLSLIDYQLSEVRTTEFTLGAGYRKRGLKLLGGLTLPKFLQSKNPNASKSKLENEINFHLNFTLRDNVTANSRLDQDNNFATGGSKEITINPTIDYYLSNRVQIKLYFDQRRVTPYISSSAPLVNTRAGVQVNVSLSQ
ncbi:MAG: cell surface protein SprA [Bacteroidetes bacterium]|nr:cell surface protein SprA [Bacteroidota bacterium]